MKRLKARFTFLSFIIIALAAYLSFQLAMPQNSDDDSDDQFSTRLAFKHVEKMSVAPHYVGSKAHKNVRNYIIKELESLGLQPQIQEGFTLDSWGNISKPQNVLARIKGRNSSKALVLLSHYDSDPHSSYGASDAASGVATILEGLRAFLATNQQPENDIIVMLSDGEELGLNGAELFVNEHPWAKDVGLVLNFEARGSGGPSIMLLETNNGNAKLIQAFKEAHPKYPVGNSLAYSIYKMLPNDTDLTVFREDGNIQGFNFAFIDDHFDYHTANDIPENLDRNTLTHQGSYLMPLLSYFASADLTDLTTDDELIYFNTPLGFHTYPYAWIFPMLIIITLLFIGLLIYGFHKKMLSWRGIGKGAVAFFIALIVSAIITFLLWKLITWIYPHYGEIQQGFTYNGYTYIAMFAFLSLAIVFQTYHTFGKKVTPANLTVVPLFFWIVLNVLVALYLKGASFFSIPVIFCLLSLFFLIRQKEKPSVLLLTFLALPAVVIMSPFIKLFPVGLGLKIIVVVAILITLILGLIMPVFSLLKRKKWTAYVFYVSAIIAFIVAHFNSDFSEIRQKPNSLVYVFDADKNIADWNTYDHILDPWTENYIKADSRKASSKDVMDSKYGKSFTFSESAPVKSISEPVIEVLQDTIVGRNRNIHLKIIPQRTVHRMEVFRVNDVALNSVKINGIAVDNDIKNRRRLISYYVTENEPLELSFTTNHDDSPEFILYEASFDLLENPLFSIPPRPKNTMPKPFVLNDAILVKKRIQL